MWSKFNSFFLVKHLFYHFWRLISRNHLIFNWSQNSNIINILGLKNYALKTILLNFFWEYSLKFSRVILGDFSKNLQKTSLKHLSGQRFINLPVKSHHHSRNKHVHRHLCAHTSDQQHFFARIRMKSAVVQIFCGP